MYVSLDKDTLLRNTPTKHQSPICRRKIPMAKGKYALVQTIKKIPIFTGLSPSQIQSILDICTSVKRDPNHTLYAANSDSDRMHILLSGELSVVNDEGIRLARLYPITTVGEMGLVTRHPRSASVETAKPSNLLVLQRPAFEALLRSERELQTKFYQNVIGILAGKIVGDNVRVRDHLLEKVGHQRDLRIERRRADTIMQLLVENSDLSEEEAKGLIDERMVPQRMRVLIVDDEPAVCVLVAQALAGNYDVDEALDGTEAMKAVETNPPDLVITDIRMPHMDGTALLKALRNIAPNLPVIALSGYVDPQDVEEYDFDGFIKKPFELDDFRIIVDQTTAKIAE